MILLEKAKRLAESGDSVHFIVAYDDIYQFTLTKGEPNRVDFSEKDHFLFQSIRKQLAPFENIRVECIHVWEVLPRVNTLMAEGNTHVFVDEFRLEPGVNFRKVEEYVMSLEIPEVFFANNANKKQYG